MSSWRYHWEDPHVRHMGPMAQDWWSAFEVGENNRTISCIDSNGVAIVSIQALHRLLTQAQEEVADLRKQIDDLRKLHDVPRESETGHVRP
ncbi:hypothetical protein [Streptomyces sp. GS7]|uniref:hypothetical protein n=1 Tax=Streptomyces sp. GS7 TaxID=2692234 RepID=UPI00191580AF|nr:hypothetical protein [Streptomyces sp. GS7]